MVRRPLPPWLGSSLWTAQLVGFLMLLRSVAFDRVLTIGVSLALIVGARAAMRQKTWGLLVALGASTWFASAFLLGMAPPFFVLFALLGAMPLLKSWKALAGFDRGAAVLAAGIASSAGAATALAWKMFAPWLFWNIPAFRPSAYAGHGLALAAIMATAVVLAVRDGRAMSKAKASSSDAEDADASEGAETVHHRIADPVRIDTTDTASLDHETEHDVDEEHRAEPERRASRKV